MSGEDDLAGGLTNEDARARLAKLGSMPCRTSRRSPPDRAYAGALVRRGEATAIVTPQPERAPSLGTPRNPSAPPMSRVPSKEPSCRVVRILVLFNGVIIVLLVVFAYSHKMPAREMTSFVKIPVFHRLKIA
jgi:hypothetical protein